MENQEQKLQIPSAALQPGVTEKDGVKQTIEVKEEYTFGVTEERVKISLDPYKFAVQIFVPFETARAIVNKIQDCYEIKNGQWHYIPRNYEPGPDESPKNNASVEFYCIDDKKALKRFTKTISKYFPYHIVEWIQMDDEAKQLIAELNNQ